MTKRTGFSTRILAWLSQILYLVGRPIYLLLIGITNIALFLLSLTGIIFLHGPEAIKLIISLLYSLFRSLFLTSSFLLSHFLKALFRKIAHLSKSLSIRLKKITLPKITFPKIIIKTKKTKPRPKAKAKKPTLKIRLASLLIFIGFIASAIFFGIYQPFIKDLPDPNSLITREQSLTTTIRARDGTVLFELYQDQNRSLTKLEDIPQSLVLATIAIEDKNFYNHPGFSYRGIVRAIRRNTFDQKLEGGSTITQQLIKNALLTPERTLSRKIKEILLALLVEIRFSKDEILEMYFNEVAYGGTAYGVEAAAQSFFSKPVSELNLSESTLLAGLPAAPTLYSPFGANPEQAKFRQKEVIRRMHQDGYISSDQANKAISDPLHFAPQATNITAPHFVMYVKDLLVKQFGEDTVLKGGLDVTTSLDLNVQLVAQQAVKDEIDKLVSLNITNGATLVTNPRTGEILAMVGSKDYFDLENDGQVNVTTRPRQPGSSIKPVNYAYALENGLTPATIIQDSPICYDIPNQPRYCPRNYDNTFHGPTTLRTALASSYNIPAVKTLSVNGVTNMIDQGKNMGITTWEDRSRFGLSLTLGGGEVLMTDMAVVYGTLANYGLRVSLQPLQKVTNSSGFVLYQHTCQGTLAQELANPPQGTEVPDQAVSLVQAAPKNTVCSGQRALSPEVAFQLTDILSDNPARAPAFGSNSVLNVSQFQVPVKTGTTQNLRDNWTIGYTSDYVVATWVGNNDNTPMSYVASGVTGASPIWRSIIDHLLTTSPPAPFSPPSDLIQAPICTLTGQLTCSGCPTKLEYFIPGTEPKNRCSQEQIETIKQDLEEKKQERDRILTGASTP